MKNRNEEIIYYQKRAQEHDQVYEKPERQLDLKAVKNYLKTHQFKNVKTTDFIKEVEKSSGKNLTKFVVTWLESDVLHYDKLEAYLSKNTKDYKLLFELDCEASKSNCLKFIETTKNNFLKAEVINRLDNFIRPLLENLAKDSDKEYIYWPNRIDIINKKIEELDEIQKTL